MRLIEIRDSEGYFYGRLSDFWHAGIVAELEERGVLSFAFLALFVLKPTADAVRLILYSLFLHAWQAPPRRPRPPSTRIACDALPIRSDRPAWSSQDTGITQPPGFSSCRSLLSFLWFAREASATRIMRNCNRRNCRDRYDGTRPCFWVRFAVRSHYSLNRRLCFISYCRRLSRSPAFFECIDQWARHQRSRTITSPPDPFGNTQPAEIRSALPLRQIHAFNSNCQRYFCLAVSHTGVGRYYAEREKATTNVSTNVLRHYPHFPVPLQR